MLGCPGLTVIVDIISASASILLDSRRWLETALEGIPISEIRGKGLTSKAASYFICANAFVLLRITVFNCTVEQEIPFECVPMNVCQLVVVVFPIGCFSCDIYIHIYIYMGSILYTAQ